MKPFEISVQMRPSGSGGSFKKSVVLAEPTPPKVLPSISMASAASADMVGGTNTVYIPVSLSAVSTDTVQVDWATSDGTGVAGTDYTAASGTLTFAPGELVKNVVVVVLGKSVYSINLTMFITLSNPVEALIAVPVCTLTMLNTLIPVPSSVAFDDDFNDTAADITASHVPDVGGGTWGQDPAATTPIMLDGSGAVKILESAGGINGGVIPTATVGTEVILLQLFFEMDVIETDFCWGSALVGVRNAAHTQEVYVYVNRIQDAPIPGVPDQNYVAFSGFDSVNGQYPNYLLDVPFFSAGEHVLSMVVNGTTRYFWVDGSYLGYQTDTYSILETGNQELTLSNNIYTKSPFRITRVRTGAP